MIKRMNMKRFIYFFVFFLMLTLSLFYLLNAISSRTLQKSLIRSSMNQMDYADSILRGIVSEASQYSIQYTVDDRVRLYYSEKQSLGNYDAQMKKNDIFDRISDPLLSSHSIDSIGIYWRTDGDFVTTSRDLEAIKPFLSVTSRGWKRVDGSLYYFSVSPFVRPSLKPADIQYVVGVKLKTEYLAELLKNAVNSDSSSAFFLINKTLLISDKPVESAIVEESRRTVAPNGQEIMKFDYHSKKGDYYILSKYVPQIDTYLVTYTRMSDFLVPLNQTRQVFSISIVVIFIIGLIVIFIFYRNFYRSVYLLDKKFSQVEHGNYNTRIIESPHSEFNSLFHSFNHMVAQIQSLFASLKIETDLRKNAEFKQLQAQINPHFLYNSLFFIMSMARTSPDSVVLMSKHLAEYYRYITKLGSREVTFASELELADHFLVIMSLCKNLEFTIQLPRELEDLPVMPLIIQPMVENAIQHGIEGHQGARRVSIEVEHLSDVLLIRISDDGKGLDPEQIQSLLGKIDAEEAPEGTRGIGLWNVNQRLKNAYGKASGLSFSRNEWGGLTVEAHIHLSESEDVSHAIIDRG